jgi:hypothetical protein
MWQRLGALGVVYALLYAVGVIALNQNEPGISASPSAVVHYYNAHRDTVLATVFIMAVAMVVFAFFLGVLGRALSASAADDGYLLAVTMLGGAIYIGGFLFDVVIKLALVDAAHYHQLGITHTLNFLDQDSFVPFVCGLAIIALATGIAGLWKRALPRWLAWASLLLGIICLAGPAGVIAFFVTPIWTLTLGILLARRRIEAVDTPAVEPLTSSAPRASR